MSTMRDPGLQEACRAAGGADELARRIGIPQSTLSRWDRVPAERVHSVEAATGVSRALLRPDLFAEASDREAHEGADEIDTARMREYALLSTLLRRSPDAGLLARVACLRCDESRLGMAHAALAEAAARVSVKSVEREYFQLFIGVGRGELLPYASYYLTGFLHERPLARLRRILAGFGIERAQGEIEPEDHAAILCEIMAGLAGGRFTAPPGTEHLLFEKHVAPWMGRFFADLEHANAADFYRHVGALGRVFLQIESEAFALTA
jgi:TorA maturation chaperone TorD